MKAIDKSTWGDGPWQDEPDKIQWIYNGLDCLAVRNLSGVWCGYVGVPKEHPGFGKKYDDMYMSVHGGLTYSGHIRDTREDTLNADVWWIGFDCNHYDDYSPVMAIQMPGMFNNAMYRDLAFVRAETERLADQLQELWEAYLLA
jgi:hypothetical protein